MNLKIAFLLTAVALLGLLAPGETGAEQKQRLGQYDVHYVVVQSTFFSEEIARRYRIVRGRDRAIVNLSVQDPRGTAVAASLKGTVTNLLGQSNELAFREIREGGAIYYLADVRFTDGETLRFTIRIGTPDGRQHTLEFLQQMYLGEQ